MNDLKERNKCVEDNMGLVYMVAKKFVGRGVDLDDIVQIGTVGLIKAGDRFDKGIGVKFSTYAVTLIIGEIKRYFRDDGIVKIPRNIKELGGKVAKATDVIRKVNNREPTIGELSKYLGVDKEQILESLDAMQPCASIFEENDKNVSIYETIADNRNDFLDIEDGIFLKEILANLDGRLRHIIIMRFFKDKTQSMVAKEMGISQVQVSRLEKKALETLKKRSELLT